ncbi:hypothetical protein [Maioricimonas sp. JC845]|uniref:hypothetical protein n=1 Tax=Maioricimonas sp. JC845 TaxID=3232138 RepID=UPI003458AE1A
MEPMQAGKQTVPVSPGQFIAWLLWLTVATISLFIAGRAIAGSFERSPSAFFALSATLLALAATLSAWWLDAQSPRQREPRSLLATGAFSVLLPIGLGLCLAGPATPATLAVLLLLALTGLVGVGAVTWRLAGPVLSVAGAVEPAAVSSAEFESEPLPVEPEETPIDDWAEETPLDDESVQQQLTRRRLPDGLDVVEAVMRVRFAAGQKHVVLHMPLWPPLAPPMEVECEPLSDHDVRIEATLVRQYGSRIEVTRTGSLDEAEDVTIGVLASGKAVPGEQAA